MTRDESSESRRHVLRYAAGLSLGGIAGCVGGGGDGSETPPTTDPEPLVLPADKERCVSQEGIERDPESVLSKEAAQYQRHPDYQGESGYIEMCANCRFFCPVTALGEAGGCTAVAGGIQSQHWCGLWQPTERIANLDRSSASKSSRDR